MYTKIYWVYDFANGAKLGIMPRPRGDDWLEEEIIKLKKQNIGLWLSSSGIPTTSYYERKKTFELYTFGSLRPVFILYDALLNGQFRKSEHTIGFNDMRHLILEFDGGVAISIPIQKRNLLELKLRLSGLSPEFKLANRPPSWHYWGGLHLAFSHHQC
jgi:hypothetical protein